MNNDYATQNRLLQVKNNTTGEIKLFTITRAGLYQLAKFVALGNSKQQIVNALNYVLGSSEIMHVNNRVDTYFFRNKVFCDLGLQPNTRSWDRCGNTTSFDIVNIKYDSIMGSFRFKDEVLCLGLDRYVPREVRKCRIKCNECGELFYDQKLIQKKYTASKARSICRLIQHHELGYDCQCADCLYDKEELYRCADCGMWIESDEGTWIDDDIYCDTCRDNNFVCCDHCGEWCRSDEAIFTNDDYTFCCERCAEREGYHYSDRREEWVSDDDYDDDVDEYISDYHDHKGDLSPVYAEKRDKRVKQPLFSGRETEVDGCDRYSFDSSYYESLYNDFGGNCVFEQDGSVEFEIITRPMDEKSFKTFNWEKGFKRLRDKGWTSHDNSSCGTHFHYSIGYLGFTDKERRNNAKKVCRFVQMHWDDICKIARRQGNHYCYPWNYDIDKNTDFNRLSDDRYYAVNLDNFYGIGTIEVRICKGTLITNTMLASHDFFLHIIRNAKRIAWKNIDNLNLWFKGIKSANTIEYIKSRHAFEGAF